MTNEGEMAELILPEEEKKVKNKIDRAHLDALFILIEFVKRMASRRARYSQRRTRHVKDLGQSQGY